MIYFEELLKKVTKRVMRWKNRLLTSGGIYFIGNACATIYAHIFAICHKPSKRGYWAITQNILKTLLRKHWGSKREALGGLDKLCYPKEEGGLHFRSLQDMVATLFANLWWIFRTSTNSLWEGIHVE